MKELLHFVILAFINPAFVLSRAQSELLPESEFLGFKSFKTPNKLLNCVTASNLYWLTVTMQIGKDGLTER